jgi:hypothetical protein
MAWTALQGYILLTFFCVGLFSGKTMGQRPAENCLSVLAPPFYAPDTLPFDVSEKGWRLQADGAGETAIWLATEGVGSRVITVEGLLDFSPSPANRLSLAGVHRSDTGGVDRGWLLHLGAVGSEDRLELSHWSRSEGRGDLIGEGRFVHGDAPRAVVSWRVVLGEDTLAVFSREKRGLRWRHEGTWMVAGVDTSPVELGLLMGYTSTRRDKFWLYDWCLGGGSGGPLRVTHWESRGPGQCRFYFGRGVAPTGDFGVWLLPDSVPPVAVGLDSAGLGLIEAEWDELGLGVRSGPVRLGGIRDTLGGLLDAAEVPVGWFAPDLGDVSVVLSECMPDPDPSRGWPNSEFVELFNAGVDTAFLGGWTLADDRTVGEVSDWALAPGAFVVLVPPDRVADWERFSVPVAGVAPWPVLNNGADRLELRNSLGMVMDSLSYDRDRLEPKDQRGGGWSIERPLEPCVLSESWAYTAAGTGATPARGPERGVRCPPGRVVTRVDGQRLRLSLPGIADLTVPATAPEVEPPMQAGGAMVRVSEGVWEVALAGAPEPGRPYAVRWPKGVVDTCGGVWLEPGHRTRYARPVAPEKGELVVSEVLMWDDPAARFVELSNVGDRAVVADGLLLHFVDQDRWTALVDTVPLFPGQHRAFSPEPCRLSSYYGSPDTAGIVFAGGLSSMASGAGRVQLIRVEGISWTVIDEVYYDPSWHLAALRGRRDVSLERKDLGGDGLEAANWGSSLPPGPGATPGMANSRGGAAGDPAKGPAVLGGAVAPGDPYRRWACSWSLGDGQWHMMVEAFTLEGQRVGFLRGPGPVLGRGEVEWSYGDLPGPMAPGLYLLAARFWSDKGRSKKYTGYGLILP